MSENKRRRSSSPDFMGRIRQSARHIETEAKEGARRVQHEAQERVRNMTPQQKNGWRKAGRIIGTLLLVFVVTLTIFSGIFMAYINSTMRGKVEVYLDEFETKVSTELYSQDPDTGEWVMYQTLYLNSENRIWTDLEDIPKYLQKAAIAIEDKRFEKHHGVDWKGTTRAIVYTLFGKNVQGGSTITQQLVKNVTGDNEVTVKRKITEIYRALELEKRYEKDEILEAYLNEVFFGQSCYGVVTASRMYFNKDVSDLTLAECASLMGITNNPSMYDPTLSSWTRENNRERQLTILGAMLEQGKISQEEYDEAKAEDIVFSNGFTISGKYVGSDGTVTDPEPEEPSTDDTESPADEEEPTIKGRYSWFTEAMIGDVADALVEKYGITDKVRDNGTTYTAYEQAWDMVHGKGYKIYTTQNPKYQKIAEDVCYDLSNIPYTSSYTNSAGEQVEDQLQIALTIVDPTNGYVVAMIGGAGEKRADRVWNWAVNARQCGSAIKPVSTYAPALDDGTINGASVIDDYPMLLNGDVWPRNANWRYQGLTALHTAIAQSLNTCAVRTNLAYGVDRSYEFLVNKLGFENLTYTDSQQVGNMALGGFEKGVTTEEMAAAYAAFVNEGVYTKPRTFVRVEDANGNVILENEAQSTVAMKNTTAAIINHLLQEAALNGTGYEAQFSGMHIAGKTGSTNSNKDRYFVGYTPYYSCAVWAGYEHNQRIVASGNPCSAIFRKVMSAIHEELPDKDFFSCAGLTSVAVCADSGMLASDNCALDVRGSRVYTALVAADNAPTSVCTMHTAPSYTVNMADSDGNVTTVTGSVLNYQRELIEGHDEIVVEDAFMMLGGWNGFFGDEEENNDVNMPNGDHDDTMDDSVPDMSGFLG
ncbi:MAG: transglycosylase domain-containing protein [Oscillibacter sp.]|nr:transglycosylase domain-containing protein [Oscillibacter sp.]